ncbi:MAG: transcription-repair coupling factor [Proteiniphilum sp.]|jgi:transcription-repair coupling factor (superfamily II helicase)|uniref:transcription-repair coupling factor n=1 Tax=Proteiniphilum sp. TaxID=1926877 RepID=UPI002B1F8B2D|nr:transcription-repair coupling factor [Proteiniphilum sp.]MEA5129077.1 transcription-repair coupling factor [Proteiniphilum sp.]
MVETIDITQLQRLIGKHPNLAAAGSLLKDIDVLSVSGLQGSSRALFAGELFHRQPRTYLYIFNDAETAGYFYHDLTQMMGSGDVLFFPSAYKRAAKYGQIDRANEVLRAGVLSRLQDGSGPLVIVSYPDALAEKTVSREQLVENTLKVSVGDRVDSAFVSEVLDSQGFQVADYVYEPGQYAVRGSILDVFSFSSEYPYRIDFFGDEVETIRNFDLETQLSKEKFNEIRIVPEFDRNGFKPASLFGLLPGDSVIGTEDMRWIASRVESINEDELHIDPKDEEFVKADLLSKKDFLECIGSFRQIRFDTRMLDTPDATIEFNTSMQPLYHKNFDLLSESLRRFMDEGYTIYILSDSEKQQKRLYHIFEDRNDHIPFIPVNKTLHEGFSDETLKICCFTDHQIFDRFHKYSLKSDKARSGKIALTLKEINQLQPGDYVVHMDHGIGRFAGLVRLRIGDKIQEVIKLTYKNNDAVFVSIHSLHKISKYKGKEGEEPQLNKLGSGAWEKVKERTKKKIKDIARDLIKLYARRQQEKGFAFSKDTYLQTELEASFMYEDTPDQVKATRDVKADMQSERPMDRLVCGDVGFGKTEVAIRAAFKAATDGKQTAVLVPTTVLATQHYHTFRDRLADFPVKVDYLSRARSAKEQKEILLRLKEGKIDILIGTHRLVGKDVEFKDLGLLIIDEEQKFGVSVKEKLKQLKVNVDTLTMTATPIPRTLQFSLMGSRDLSTIGTPPPNRYPIQTEVHTFDIELIRDAIHFELNRNGQLFIVNNRIKNIYELEALIKREIPGVRVAVGHGQMDPKKLEGVIEDFINHEQDVLIATTIIESGIDMPNVNTIIVMDAQNFGLSDLHQLRGRVGRSNRKAFCYLLAPPFYTLSSDSRRRLQAIENFAELGSGLHIAMQDLDIRGAGNLLGAEQSGFIADLGYETYQKILEEAVQELRKDEFAELYDAQQAERAQAYNFVDDVLVESDLELMFPLNYIPNDAERVGIYREMDNMESETEIMDFMKRLEDRFGRIPSQGRELIRIVRLRRIAKSLGIEKVVLKNGQMTLFLISDPESPYYNSPVFDQLLDFVQKQPRRCRLQEKGRKRSVAISQIETVETAVALLEEIGGGDQITKS